MSSTSEMIDLGDDGITTFHEVPLTDVDITTMEVSHNRPIWLLTRVGSIETGVYAGSEVWVPGKVIAFDMFKEGEFIGSATIELSELVKFALAAIERAPKHE